MSSHPRTAVLRKLLDRALDLMAEAYREARDRNESPERIEQMVRAGRELRKWQDAARRDSLPPSDSASLSDIASAVSTFAGNDSKLYEAVLDANRFQATFGVENIADNSG